MTLSPLQRRVLEYMVRLGGEITAPQFAQALAGQPRTIRLMFSRGWVVGDAIPARMVAITSAGRNALSDGEAVEDNK